MIVIADTTCRIILQKIGKIDLLGALFGTLWITPTVAKEYGEELPEWIKIKTSQNPDTFKLLNLQLDAGEASAIALCMEMPESLLIIDERKGRKIAQELGIKIVGTLGILIKAKKAGLINSLEIILKELETTDFRLSDTLRIEALKSVNEL